MVESKSGRLLWDATIESQWKRQSDGQHGKIAIGSYRVNYTEWGTRFSEWVEPMRIVEPNENNKMLQADRLEEVSHSRHGLPPELSDLVAADYLYERERARGPDPLPDFSLIAQVGSEQSFNARSMGLMKAALFAIEAALPVGSIDNRENGPWRRPFAEKWKRVVQYAEDPALLIRCTMLLESTISPNWFNEVAGNMKACLPATWKATDEATPSALALRVIALDRAIMYETIDRKRYSARKRNRL